MEPEEPDLSALDLVHNRFRYRYVWLCRFRQNSSLPKYCWFREQDNAHARQTQDPGVAKTRQTERFPRKRDPTDCRSETEKGEEDWNEQFPASDLFPTRFMGPSHVGYYRSLQGNHSGIFPAQSSHDPSFSSLAEPRAQCFVD